MFQVMNKEMDDFPDFITFSAYILPALCLLHIGHKNKLLLSWCTFDTWLLYTTLCSNFLTPALIICHDTSTFML